MQDTPPIHASSLTVLVVDDNPLVRDVCCAMLTASGSCAVCAGSGPVALELYQERRDEIDVVLLDLKMPEMPGQTVARRLREVDPSVAILLTSGFSDEPLPSEEECGPLDFLPKPFNPARLDAALRNAIEHQVQPTSA